MGQRTCAVGADKILFFFEPGLTWNKQKNNSVLASIKSNKKLARAVTWPLAHGGWYTSHTHSHTLTRSLSHTHSLTHSHTHSLSLSLSHTTPDPPCSYGCELMRAELVNCMHQPQTFWLADQHSCPACCCSSGLNASMTIALVAMYQCIQMTLLSSATLFPKIAWRRTRSVMIVKSPNSCCSSHCYL